MATVNREELVQGVKEYAQAHYDDGWDVVVETYTDEELVETIGRARTLKGALSKFGLVVEHWEEGRANARYESGLYADPEAELVELVETKRAEAVAAMDEETSEKLQRAAAGSPSRKRPRRRASIGTAVEWIAENAPSKNELLVSLVADIFDRPRAEIEALVAKAR